MQRWFIVAIAALTPAVVIAQQPAVSGDWETTVHINGTTQYFVLQLKQTGEAIYAVRTDTGARRVLVSVGGYAIGRSVGLSRDGRWITYTETGTEGDIWLATLGQK
jgi:hypothetical protein